MGRNQQRLTRFNFIDKEYPSKNFFFLVFSGDYYQLPFTPSFKNQNNQKIHSFILFLFLF